jgi:hypothetical protein
MAFASRRFERLVVFGWMAVFVAAILFLLAYPVEPVSMDGLKPLAGLDVVR